MRFWSDYFHGGWQIFRRGVSYEGGSWTTHQKHEHMKFVMNAVHFPSKLLFENKYRRYILIVLFKGGGAARQLVLESNVIRYLSS